MIATKAVGFTAATRQLSKKDCVQVEVRHSLVYHTDERARRIWSHEGARDHSKLVVVKSTATRHDIGLPEYATKSNTKHNRSS